MLNFHLGFLAIQEICYNDSRELGTLSEPSFTCRQNQNRLVPPTHGGSLHLADILDQIDQGNQNPNGREEHHDFFILAHPTSPAFRMYQTGESASAFSSLLTTSFLATFI